MRRLLTRTLMLSASTLVLAGVAAAETREETLERTLAFAAGSRLEISNTNGEIEVSAWDREEIQIEARKKVKASSSDRAREAFEELQVLIDETPQGVKIETEYPRSSGWWGRGVSSSVDYSIRVPKRADLDLGTVNGKVRIDGVRGDLDLHTTNGGIRVEDSGGRVSARTTNGSIDVELGAVDDGEDMTFRTTNGGITLALPADVRASLVARTTNGSIHTDFPITIQGSFSRNRLEGDLNGGGGSIELRTTNGGIRIEEL